MHFEKVDTIFNVQEFTDEIMKKMLSLELKQRIGCIADSLDKQLPADFEKACALIVKALPEPLDPSKTDADFGDFIYTPLGEYVVRHGVSKKYLKISLDTLKEITMCCSMEDSIRYFLNAFPNETLKEMQKWATDSNYHVRRLVSEGTRPLLPWSGRIVITQAQTIPFLDILHTDSTRYVSRSVANHMNDIAKSEPELVVHTLKRWKKEGKQSPTELDWIICHSLRTLLKQGYNDALKLLGYDINPRITLQTIAVNRDSLKRGETLEFSLVITAQHDEKLMVDYIIDFVKANGNTKPKVFKLNKIKMKKGETRTMVKKHRLLSHATTFKLYPGTHTIIIQINGNQFGSKTFLLT